MQAKSESGQSGIWNKFNDDLARFVNIFYAATFALLFRILIQVDYDSSSVSFAFGTFAGTTALLFLIVWDFISTSFFIKVVQYKPPSYFEFIIHIVQIVALSFAVAFSLKSQSVSLQGPIWETGYFWITVYCCLMLVWNSLYFGKHEFVDEFFEQLNLDASLKSVFRIMAAVKGFFLPCIIVIPVLLFSLPSWPKVIPGFEIFIIFYCLMRTAADFLAMQLFWRGQCAQTVVRGEVHASENTTRVG